MCSYNRVDGEAACASPRLLGDILRKQWGFPATWFRLRRGGRYLPRPQSGGQASAAAALAVKAGTDLDCGTEYRSLIPALEQKLIAEAAIDTSVRRLLTARFRLGMFDPPERVPYARIPYSAVDFAAHQGAGARSRAQIHRAAEKLGRPAAAQEDHQDPSRNRAQRG